MGQFKPKGPFPLFIHDLEVDTKGWSAEERYRYLRLLTSMWRSGGKIEDSDEVIAEEMDLNRASKWREKVQKVRSKLQPFRAIDDAVEGETPEKRPRNARETPEKQVFSAESPREENGFLGAETKYLTHHRILNDIRKAAAISQKRADAGRKGGSKSLSNSLSSSEAIAPLARAVPSSSKKKKDSVDKQLLVDQQFETWWPHVPRKVDKEDARKAFKAAVKKIALGPLVAATERWAQTCVGKDPQYIKYPAGWLRGRCWNNEDIAATPNPNGSDEPYTAEYQEDLRRDYTRLRDFYGPRKFWLDDWGPKPGEDGCGISAEVWDKWGPRASRDQSHDTREGEW